MGEGADAEKLADVMNNAGEVFVAVPKGGGTATPKCPSEVRISGRQ
jgi:hypothetical protein